MRRKRWRFIVGVGRFIKNKLLAEIRKKRHKKPLHLPLFLIVLFIAWGIISSPVFSQGQPANGEVLIEQGRKLYENGELSTAVMILQQAASSLRTKGDKLGEAIALSNLSLAFKQLGQWEKAEMAIAQSLQIFKNLTKYPKFSISFGANIRNSGNLQLELGKPELAFKHMETS